MRKIGEGRRVPAVLPLFKVRPPAPPVQGKDGMRPILGPIRYKRPPLGGHEEEVPAIQRPTCGLGDGLPPPQEGAGEREAQVEKEGRVFRHSGPKDNGQKGRGR